MWQWLLDLFRRKPTPMPTPANPGTAKDLVAAINAERLKKSKPALVEDMKLDSMAQSWAGNMAKSENMTHGNFKNRIAHAYPNTSAGEDIASGQQTINQVVTAWMNSPPHRANILGDFNVIGVDFAVGENNVIYWCLDFAKL